jgi:leucyl aminopeptidase (aminopeptidase T)
MSSSRIILGVGAGIVLLATALGLAPQTEPQTEPAKAGSAMQPDFAAVAKTIVNESSGIRYDELVLIEGSKRDLTLLEHIAVEVRKLGAHPLVVLQTENMAKEFYTKVPEKFDTQAPKFADELSQLINARISVAWEETPDLFANVPNARLQNHEKASAPIHERMLERGVVQTELGNGLYPTPALASQFGITQDELTKLFWNGVNVDYAALQRTASKVQSAITAGKQIRITAPNGTNLTLDVTERQVFASDGVVSSEDRYAMGPACQVWLPAGEVYFTPKPGTAQGTFVADNFFYQGQHVKNLKLEFNAGKLVSLTGDRSPGLEALMKRYDECKEQGKDLFAAVDIGINPNVKTPSSRGAPGVGGSSPGGGGKFVSWVAEGTVTIGIGNNSWAGGENKVAFDLFAHLPTSTLAIDGKNLIEEGKLLVK